jgi:hypothetical protein
VHLVEAGEVGADPVTLTVVIRVSRARGSALTTSKRASPRINRRMVMLLYHSE